jgi:hypothetical protein
MVQKIQKAGFPAAAVIGEVTAGPQGRIVITE